RVDVAATGPRSPVPPGIPRVPGPGEFYASPALSALLRTTPAAELRDRFPGREIGTIGDSALPAPNSLLIIAGHTPQELSQWPRATQVTSIMTSRCGGCDVGIRTAGLNLLLSAVAAALLFPVLVFIGGATRLAATRREQRFAAMRLVGATPGQVSAISAVESTVATVAGAAAGFALFLLLRPALATIPFTGAPFFPEDLTLGVFDILFVAVGVPVGAVVAARLALRRVRISPLGVSRRVTGRPPRAWRLLPLAAGIGELVYFADRRPDSTDGQTAAYLSGILMIMVGLVVAGPWLTMLGSRALARRARRPATLIAARRLADNPQAGFRTVSGLMLALFVTSVATGVITTIVANRGAPRTGSVFSGTLSATYWPEERVAGQPAPTVDSIPAGLRSIPGVRTVTAVHANPRDRPTPVGAWRPGVIACAELARTPALGSCPAGARVVAVHPDLIGPRDVDSPDRATVWPAAALAPDDLRGLPLLSVVVDTDGSTSAIERARTLLQGAFPASPRFPPPSARSRGTSRATSSSGSSWRTW
ncbi:MAG TPA: FtsX-like permease family protein, partial [Catenuloplanes sp.]